MNKKYKVAVIEDDEVLSKVIMEELGDAGFEMVRAFDGEEGLTLILAEKPDIVLLDIVMPKMDGMTMMKKLRESGDYGKKVPIVLLTNLNADDKIMAGVIKDEPSYYLVKSKFTITDVVEKVKERLGV